MISGFSDVSMGPKTNVIYFWRHQDTPNNPRKNFIFGNFKIVEISNFENLGKDRHRKNHEDPLQKILETLNMGPRSSKKHGNGMF